MTRWLRRILLLGLLGGGGYAGYSAWKRKQGDATTTAPSWPPFESSPTGAPATPASRPDPFASAETSAPIAEPPPVANTRWVAPVDGQCPDGYPVKANDNSGIFHIPGGRFYVRTVPERCYANATDAEADGYRPAKA